MLVDDLGSEDGTPVADRSQPEFDFEDDEPALAAPRPPKAPSAPAVAAAAPVAAAVVAAPQPETVAAAEETPAVVPPPAVVVEEAAAVEVIADVKAEAARVQPEVTATVQHEAPTAAAIVETVRAEIAAEPTPRAVEAAETPVSVATTASTADAAETPVPATLRAEPVQIDLVDAVNEATAEAESPVEAVTPPPPAAPKPVSEPATGSLFFVADADTPPSITRSLFEPAVTPVKPVDEAAGDKQDDDTTEERSA